MERRNDRDYARMILPHIPGVMAIDGRSGASIVAAIGGGFSLYKLRRGAAYIRDNYYVAADVLITDRRGRYRFTANLADIQDWVERGGKAAETIVRRRYTGGVEHVHRDAEKKHPRRVGHSRRAYKKLMADLQLLLQPNLF